MVIELIVIAAVISVVVVLSMAVECYRAASGSGPSPEAIAEAGSRVDNLVSIVDRFQGREPARAVLEKPTRNLVALAWMAIMSLDHKERVYLSRQLAAYVAKHDVHGNMPDLQVGGPDFAESFRNRRLTA